MARHVSAGSLWARQMWQPITVERSPLAGQFAKSGGCGMTASGARRTLRRLQRPVAENGCDTIQPFRAMSPSNLRLKSRGPSRVRSAALVWLVLRHADVDEPGRF